MGNASCSRRRRSGREGPEAANPALQVIRDAQRKYFNNHIEYSRDDSCDEDDDKEDSIDFYGSETSLDNLDDGSYEGSVQDTTLDSSDAATLPRKKSSDSLLANGKDIAPVAVANAPQNGGLETVAVKKKVVKRKPRAKFIRLSKRANFFSIYNHEDKKARSVDPQLYQYPFESLVFEGGGNKGLAYCGAVRVSDIEYDLIGKRTLCWELHAVPRNRVQRQYMTH